MDAKEYLEAYSNYDRIENRYREECEDEKEALREIILYYNQSATSAWRKENGQSIQACINHCNQLTEMANYVAEKKNAILKMIESIPGMDGDVIRLRYIDGLKWEEITERVFYSWNGVFKCHNRALLKIQEKLDAIDRQREPGGLSGTGV